VGLATALAEDLLEQARHLARREKRRPKQASLRRAVSTAYYSLFHLLIAEAVANWKRSDQRAALARAFDHSRMKSASKEAAGAQFSGQNTTYVDHLKTVAKAFIQLQQSRNAADYDNSQKWSRTQVLQQINLATEAFTRWRAIRTERIAQDYLLSFFTVKRS
jgi:uncharacterized protein (UPF0332 family)